MPDCVYKMGNLRIVDLTKVLDPKTESRRCHLIRYNHRRPDSGFPHRAGSDQPPRHPLRVPVSSL